MKELGKENTMHKWPIIQSKSYESVRLLFCLVFSYVIFYLKKKVIGERDTSEIKRSTNSTSSRLNEPSSYPVQLDHVL